MIESMLEGVAVEDTVHGLARHGDVLASYSLNQHQAPNEMTLTVVCERGVVRCEFHENRWRWATTPGEPWRDEPIAPLERALVLLGDDVTSADAVNVRFDLADALWDSGRDRSRARKLAEEVKQSLTAAGDNPEGLATVTKWLLTH